jgi:rubrerythrin
MFQRLAAEESDHLRRLQAEHRSLLEKNNWLKREPARLPLSRKIVEEIFPQHELLKIEVKDETSDIDALNIAMNLERRSHQIFVDFAKQIPDPNGRKIFTDFARDEESHLQALLTEYNSLVRPS